MTLHVSTFARRRWHDIKTTRGSLYVYIRCHDRVFSSVASNRESVSFGGTERRVSQAVQLCGVLSPFLHLPHSSLRLEYLSVHDESVYRRLHDNGEDQWYAQNSSIEGEPTEHQLKLWVKSINKHDRVPCSLLRIILASCQIKALYKFLLLVSRRMSGNRYLEVASCNEFPAYSISTVCTYIYIYTRMLVCNFVAFIFRQHRNVSWQLCYFAVHPGGGTGVFLPTCSRVSFLTYLHSCARFHESCSLNFITWWFPRESRCNVVRSSYCVVYYVVRIDTRTGLFTFFYSSVRKISVFFFLNIFQTIRIDSIYISILLLLLSEQLFDGHIWFLNVSQMLYIVDMISNTRFDIAILIIETWKWRCAVKHCARLLSIEDWSSVVSRFLLDKVTV